MNKNLYLNIVVTLGLAALIILLVIMINAMDRVFLKNQRILEKIESIEDSLQNAPKQYVSAKKSINKAPAIKETKAFAKIGNVQFFDPKAQTGGRIISAISADTANMNTLINNDSTVSTFTELCSSSLATRNLAKPEIFEPLMAESWTISPDKKVYTIKLRRGILWHDFKDPVSGKVWKNKEVTAHDFKFYIDVIKHPKVNCAPIRVYYRDLEKLEVIDDYTFKVHWKNRYFRSEELTLGLSPLPRHLYHAYPGPFNADKFNEDHQRNRILIGCGPYRFLSWDKDRRVVFTRFQKYFGNKLGIAPPIKYCVFEIIKHPNTRFQALLASKLDRLGLEPVQWVKRTNTPEFAPDGKLRKMKYLSRAYYYMGYNLTRPQFKDKRVRQALTHLVNRKKILKDVYYGLGKIVTGPFYSETPYYDKSIKPYDFSVSEAKKLLAE